MADAGYVSCNFRLLFVWIVVSLCDIYSKLNLNDSNSTGSVPMKIWAPYLNLLPSYLILLHLIDKRLGVGVLQNFN